MPTADDLYAMIIENYHTLEAIPEEAHLLCPKVNDFDIRNGYDEPDEPGEDITVEEKTRRIQDGEERLKTSYQLAFILGLQQDQVGSWSLVWKTRVENCLTKCDQCVRNWHSGRASFLRSVLDMFDDNIRAIMEQKLNEMDKGRIDKALALAEKLLQEKGPMTTSQLAKNSPEAAIGLMEALCCMPYLSSPANRLRFNYVFETTQRRKPLKMLGMIPTMTYFLFDDDHYRNTFARTAWENLTPGSLTQKEWEWAVHDHLAEAVTQVAFSRGVPTREKIEKFWDGFLLIIRALSEEQVVHRLRAMEVQPSVYMLSLDHCVRVNSGQTLALLMKALRMLMEKSPKAFWAAFDENQVTPNALVEQIFTSPAFGSLLADSLEPAMMVEDGDGNTPSLAAWVKAFIKSLPLNRRTNLCEFLLRHLFEKFVGPQYGTEDGRATCILAGLNAIHQTLEGFLDPAARVDAGTSLIYINTLINLVVKYKDIIINSAKLRAQDRITVGRSAVAESVIRSALGLDSKAVYVEWNAIHENGGVPQTVQRQSPEMWEAFTTLLWAPRVKVATNMLMALMPLRSIEQFRARRGEKLTDETKLQFNARYAKVADAIGAMLRALSDFPPGDLHNLCVATQPQTIFPIVASVMHGEQAIREAGIGLVKGITGEAGRASAVQKMLEEYFSQFLDAFSDAVRKMTFAGDSHKPWGPMNPILQLSEDILDALSDLSVGLLRSRDLTQGEIGAVKRWWEVMWQCVSCSFRSIRSWHEKVEKKILENFFRSNMELADKHLAQDGLLASVFSHKKKTGILPSDGNEESTARAMKEVLEHPGRNSFGIVEMLQIRDLYLVRLAVDILVKLIRRIRENDMTLPANSVSGIYSYCKKTARGDYIKKSNLTDMQRADILKALGADADDTSEDDEVQYIESKPLDKSTVKKPTSLPDFFKAQVKSGTSLRTNRDDVLDLTSSVEKNMSILDKMKARQALKPEKKPGPKAPDQAAILAFREARKREKADKAKRVADAQARARALRQPAKIVPGEGSGLQGIAGIKGKDHSLAQKDEMMVGSSSEDDDDESEDDAILMGSSKLGQKPLNRDQRKMLAEKRPVKKVKLQRSAKDMRARLIPPMHVLHQAILEWDIFHEGNDPPNGYKCSNVADTYASPSDYKHTFFPLLVSEAWRSFVTSKDETTLKPYGIKVLTRMSVDNFMEVTTAMPVAQNKDRNLSEGDIVIISKAEDPRSQSQLPHCLARIFKTTYKKDTLEVVYRLSAKSRQILPVLIPSADFFAVKITNMITIEREYAALESLQYYDLMDEVLKAKPSPILKFGEQAITDVMNNYKLNTGQAKAILNAKENDGFTLVQGPPGTGKTKTIVAMVGCLLTGVLKAATGAVAVTRPGGAVAHAGGGTSKKLLVCAPSNAAVDEIVLRLKQGVKTMSGSFHKISVLRLGRTDAINAAVKDVTLDELVNARMNVEVKQNSNFSDWDRMHKEAGEIKQKLAELRPALEAAREESDRGVNYLSLQRQFNDLKARQAHMGARIDTARDSGNTYAREVEIKRRQVQQEILDKAQVICATLSGSGHEMFKNLNVEFETVIIDEAAQCVELSALIPLKYGCSKCILVGDPKQLPPTVLSQSAARYGYDQSLFVRMQHNHPEDVHLLDRQYRMHPEISQFPSQEFYEGRLEDGADMAKLRIQPWHESSLLGPYRFFDVRGVQTRGSKGQSLVNMEEIKTALQLYKRFRTDYRTVDLKAKIGIITPYKAQLFTLRDQFIRQFGDTITDQIEFNTTDAFQGRECEIIIFSCVRASPTGGIGFMTDIRRMNVGLTRAKSSLWILGDSRALSQGEYWSRLITDAKRRDRYTEGNVLGLLAQPSARVPGFTMSRSGSPASFSSSVFEKPKVVEEKPDVVMLGVDADEDEEEYEPPPAVPVKAPSESVHSKTLPSYPPLDLKSQVKPQPMTTPVGNRPVVPVPQHMPHGMSVEKVKHVDGFSQRSQAGVGRPIINTSPPLKEEPEKKRYLDPNSDHPAAKRFKNAPSVLARPLVPRAPRLHNTSYPPPKPPTDPSAMEVLGLVPPTRPPAMTNKPPPPGPSNQHGARPGPSPPQPYTSSNNAAGTSIAPMGPRMQFPKKKVDPFIKNRRPRNR